MIDLIEYYIYIGTHVPFPGNGRQSHNLPFFTVSHITIRNMDMTSGELVAVIAFLAWLTLTSSNKRLLNNVYFKLSVGRSSLTKPVPNAIGGFAIITVISGLVISILVLLKYFISC